MFPGQYQRTMPRDCFNEAKLLKCLGQLSLKAHDGHLDCYEAKCWLENEYAGFPIEYDQTFHGLRCDNFRLSIKGIELYFYSAYNSKTVYPLYFVAHDTEDIYPVFTDEGEFTIHFLTYATRLYAIEQSEED